MPPATSDRFLQKDTETERVVGGHNSSVCSLREDSHIVQNEYLKRLSTQSTQKSMYDMYV